MSACSWPDNRSALAFHGILLFVAGAAVAFGTSGLLFGSDPNLVVWPLACLSIPILAVLVGAVVFCHPDRRSKALFLCAGVAWFALAFLALANVFLGFQATFGYGDNLLVAFVLQSNLTIPKALGTIGLLEVFYPMAATFPPVAGAVPGLLHTPAGFLKVSGLLTMAVSTLYLLSKHPNRLSVLFTVYTPVWLMFSTGYIEIYPFIAWVLPALYLWLFDRPIGTRSPLVVGIIAGALPVLYVAFLPLSILLVFSYGLSRPKETGKMLVAALFCGLVAIRLFYTKDFASFFQDMSASMNLGNSQTLFGRYQGKAAADSLVFFDARYALSGEHLVDLLYMFSFAMGLFPLVALLLGVGVGFAQGRVTKDLFRMQNFWMGCALLAWSVFYSFAMIPKFGPRQDIDLFFPTYITVSFIAGSILDQLLEGRDHKASALTVIMAALLGSSITLAVLMALVGLPEGAFDVGIPFG